MTQLGINEDVERREDNSQVDLVKGKQMSLDNYYSIKKEWVESNAWLAPNAALIPAAVNTTESPLVANPPQSHMPPSKPRMPPTAPAKPTKPTNADANTDDSCCNNFYVQVPVWQSAPFVVAPSATVVQPGEHDLQLEVMQLSGLVYDLLQEITDLCGTVDSPGWSMEALCQWVTTLLLDSPPPPPLPLPPAHPPGHSTIYSKHITITQTACPPGPQQSDLTPPSIADGYPSPMVAVMVNDPHHLFDEVEHGEGNGVVPMDTSESEASVKVE
ncbi:hypothetical protein JVU11DRAFT_3198 [Chiua virens]|nr:hypothetical protein JVU11DRAFT_3198 [Chiua virens]